MHFSVEELIALAVGGKLAELLEGQLGNDFWKVYQVLSDRSAARERYARAIDESGEHYLYRVEYFVRVKLPVAMSSNSVSLSNGVRQPVRRILART
jgi:hypothetical protein